MLRTPAPFIGALGVGWNHRDLSGCEKLWQAIWIDLFRRKTAMPTTLEALQAEVLRLSPVDRARLLDRLIASLDLDADNEAA